MQVDSEKFLKDLVDLFAKAESATEMPDFFFIQPKNYYEWAYPSVRYKPRRKGVKRNRRKK